MVKIGPNERCICGSGKKYKRCCGDPRVPTEYTAQERRSALRQFEEWLDAFAEAEIEEGLDLFWWRYLDRILELPDELALVSTDVAETWAAFDYIGGRGVSLAGAYLAEAVLADGERAYLTALSRSTMRLYEVVDAAPGHSLTLRDVVEGNQLTLNEHAVSRTVVPHALVAARILPRGPSGGSELEPGLLYIPRIFRDGMVTQLREMRAHFRSEYRDVSIELFYKAMPPFFHEVWIRSYLELQAHRSPRDHG
ncbi:MAG TPA: SEC-C metal-binding domain-containing protein [Kofleriaceae bacterium]|nr:SEC-C metal-binding domain-containing protein [Kofleriaceae bacterium]